LIKERGREEGADQTRLDNLSVSVCLTKLRRDLVSGLIRLGIRLKAPHLIGRSSMTGKLGPFQL
jgi:hypothetical protein